VCKSSADKRAAALAQLLGKRNLTEPVFEKWLIDLVQSWNITNAAEQDKKQRRWVDYACKQVEQLLLANHWASSHKRHQELAAIFDRRNHEELTAYYNQHSLQSNHPGNDYNSLIYAYNIELRWLARNQTQKNIIKIGSLLLRQKEATELSYHQQLSYFYNVSSALYIDNPGHKNYLKITPGKAQFVALCNAAKSEYSRLLYQLAETRFSFYNRLVFEKEMQAAFTAVQKSGLDENLKQQLERSCLYLRITGGLYYGFKLNIMLSDAERMLQLMLRHKIYDSIGFFFLLFFLLIDNKPDKYLVLLQKHKHTFFTNENKDYLLFLESLYLYRIQQPEQALDNLLLTSYSKSVYLSAWSRLLEIKIHTSLNNKRLAGVLLARAKRFLKTHRGHRVISEPFAYTLNCWEHKSTANHKDLFAYYLLFV